MSVGIEIKSKGKLFIPGAMEEEVSRTMSNAVGAAAVLLQSKVRLSLTSKGLVNTGALRDSVQIQRSNPKPFVFQAAVGTNLLYALPMELGTKPYFMSRDAIEGPLTLWVQRKLGARPVEARSIAWAIAVTISRKGQKARHWFEEGVDAAKQSIAKVLDDGFRRVIAKVNS